MSEQRDATLVEVLQRTLKRVMEYETEGLDTSTAPLISLGNLLGEVEATLQSAIDLTAKPSKRLNDCPLNNCDKSGRCEFPEDCDAPSSARSVPSETPCMAFDDWWNSTGADAFGIENFHACRKAWRDCRQFGFPKVPGPAVESTVSTIAPNLREIAKRHARNAVAPIGSREHESMDMITAQNIVRQEEIIYWAMREADRLCMPSATPRIDALQVGYAQAWLMDLDAEIAAESFPPRREAFERRKACLVALLRAADGGKVS